MSALLPACEWLIPVRPCGCGLLRLKGTLYWCEALTCYEPAAEADVLVGYRLTNLVTMKVHDIDVSGHRWTCDCGDWVFRREAAGTDCKHIRALKEKP